jgi:hypothetical protein
MVLLRRFLRTALLAGLAGAAVALGACSEYAFLDDFPPYPPAEPFLEERQLQRLRVEALRREEELKKNRYLTETREAALKEWRRLETMKTLGLRRIEAERERRARFQHRTGPQQLEEWEHIMR